MDIRTHGVQAAKKIEVPGMDARGKSRILKAGKQIIRRFPGSRREQED
jgi:hypothetical protein